MGNNTNPCYVYLKGNTYYFTRHVPKDVRGYYTSNRIVMCLKTQSKSLAVKAAKNISSKLEEYWLSLRLSQLAYLLPTLLETNLTESYLNRSVRLSQRL